MSRATKRRRKKKGVSSEEAAVPKPERATDMTRDAANTAPRVSADLVAAVSSCSTIRPHQLPFFDTMSKPLPTTFRLRPNQSKMNDKNDRHVRLVNNFLQQLSTFQESGIVKPIPFSVENEMFQSPLSKYQLPEPLKDLLIEYSQNGVLARQELGSMLPVIALPLRTGDCVVDMCAAPGSKTMQALERCCGAHGVGHKVESGKAGTVLANDVLESRLDALRSAVQRSGLLSTERIRYSLVDATQLQLSRPCDAVICDVPCSGDGTCRKDVHILPMWKPSSGNTLHSTQLAILKRSLELVKVGGYVCYSTCSLNPVEDEAVVAAALVSSAGTAELVEITGLTHRKGWIHRQGVHWWEVADYTEGKVIEDQSLGDDDDGHNDEIPKLTWYKTFDDAMEGGMDGAVQSMWPGDSTKRAPLERCARLWPQDYNSGGFFLALFRKMKQMD